jgi:hypothetical protein
MMHLNYAYKENENGRLNDFLNEEHAGLVLGTLIRTHERRSRPEGDKKQRAIINGLYGENGSNKHDALKLRIKEEH